MNFKSSIGTHGSVVMIPNLASGNLLAGDGVRLLFSVAASPFFGCVAPSDADDREM
jgi:hypothetical protein